MRGGNCRSLEYVKNGQEKSQVRTETCIAENVGRRAKSREKLRYSKKKKNLKSHNGTTTRDWECVRINFDVRTPEAGR